MINDTKIQKDVVDELDWEPSINAADIGVTVKNGVVTLSGHIPSYAQKRTAEEVAFRVKGVTAVAEEIEVRLSGDKKRTDADIASAALEAISWHEYLSKDDFKITVENGRVSIEGEVDWQYQRKSVYGAIRTLTGVKFVINRVKVRPHASTSKVKENIRKALNRMAVEDAASITVDVQDGVVRLGGSVRSWAEQKSAELAASAAPGVVEVVDNIRIKPHALV